ncbi:MAG: hypothetical protein NZM11_13230, partial [Anaerolineales bacterium]|nr:hypothetical protein [Anaerolineales bacterium]
QAANRMPSFKQPRQQRPANEAVCAGHQNHVTSPTFGGESLMHTIMQVKHKSSFSSQCEIAYLHPNQRVILADVLSTPDFHTQVF